MTTERWRQVERIYEEALALQPPARARYLTDTCGGDHALRREVESLLAQAASAEHFLERPALAMAGTLADSGLSAGQSVGTYRVIAKLGAGGMGEVYRAHDPQLGRDVAIKILPALFAEDADRLARFEREARVLAALNHPHIATIYGVETAPAPAGVSTRALVMELVEGPTLAERIATGPLPLNEALDIARQIADALDAAHEKGIVHRDLKPANIKVTPEGRVKVLDFGLAKAPAQRMGPSPALTQSPTFTTDTRGILLGTAAYMSPEQAAGKDVDKRSDIWAFGAVLMEMLTGRPVFTGETASHVIAAVLEKDPDWTKLPSTTPPSMRRLLRRCLEKDRRRRIADAADVRLEIEEALTSATAATADISRGNWTQRWRVVAAGAAAVAAIGVGIGAWLLTRSTSPERLIARSLIATDPWDQRPPAKPGETRTPAIRPSRKSVAISPDGSTLVFEGTSTGGNDGWRLFLRPLDRLEASPIPGTEGANNPFFSPLGTWIGFWANGEIRKVPVAGGPPTTIARVPGDQKPAVINSAYWGNDDVIVFGSFGVLWRVSASGGVPEVLSKPADGERAHIHPHILPGGREMLFTRQKTVFRWDDAQIVARSLVTGEQKVLIEDAADARYVPSGHLVFIRRGTLMAAPFDLERLILTGGPVALVDDVLQHANMGNTLLDHGAGQFAVAAQGRLVYLTGGIAPDPERALVWVNRDGMVEPLPVPGRKYLMPRLSPDGQRVSVATASASAGVQGERVWVYDISRRTLSPVTGEQERGFLGVWSPDGTQIGFQTILGGRAVLSWRSADGAGRAEQLPMSTHSFQTPGSWSLDGKIAFVQITLTTPATENDIWVLDMSTADRRAVPVVQTPAGEQDPAFSPDGRWLAYSSDESGRDEVYVQPYPGPGPRIVVSPDGGLAPAWRGDGRELYYHSRPTVKGTTMHAVPITVADSKLLAGTPRTLFTGQFVLSVGTHGYDVTPDGQRFLMVQPPRDPPRQPPSQMVLVENWVDELQRRVPSK